jgi:hypothetical protein
MSSLKSPTFAAIREGRREDEERSVNVAGSGGGDDDVLHEVPERRNGDG